MQGFKTVKRTNRAQCVYTVGQLVPHSSRPSVFTVDTAGFYPPTHQHAKRRFVIGACCTNTDTSKVGNHHDNVQTSLCMRRSPLLSNADNLCFLGTSACRSSRDSPALTTCDTALVNFSTVRRHAHVFFTMFSLTILLEFSDTKIFVEMLMKILIGKGTSGTSYANWSQDPKHRKQTKLLNIYESVCGQRTVAISLGGSSRQTNASWTCACVTSYS